jgi:hypothetical protein
MVKVPTDRKTYQLLNRVSRTRDYILLNVRFALSLRESRVKDTRRQCRIICTVYC